MSTPPSADGADADATLRTALSKSTARVSIVQTIARDADDAELWIYSAPPDGFTLAYRPNPNDPPRTAKAKLRDPETIVAIVRAFRANQPGWDESISWSGGAMRIPVFLIALFVLGIPYVIAMSIVDTNAPGAPARRDMLLGGIAVTAIAVLIQYYDIFARVIRPALRRRLAKLLNIPIAESLQSDGDPIVGSSGSLQTVWEAPEGAGAGKHALVFAADLLTVVIGLLVPAVIILAIGVLIALRLMN